MSDLNKILIELVDLEDQVQRLVSDAQAVAAHVANARYNAVFNRALDEENKRLRAALADFLAVVGESDILYIRLRSALASYPDAQADAIQVWRHLLKKHRIDELRLPVVVNVTPETCRKEVTHEFVDGISRPCGLPKGHEGTCIPEAHPDDVLLDEEI